MTDRDFLHGIKVFSGLEPGEIDVLSGYLTSVKLKRGDILFREGEPGNDLYIIKSGAVSVGILLPDGSEHEIARFALGDFFGEMSIFDNAERSATCRALEKAVLYSLSKKAFSGLINERPSVAMKLMYEMLKVTTQRLRSTSELVTDMVQWGESASKRAVTDELTGAYNRRFLEDSLGGYVVEAGEKGRELSLAMVDLDHFRQINEAYGQGTGDKVIHDAAEVFKRLLRPRDILARYGGDEFVIVFPETDISDAEQVASSICHEVAGLGLLRDVQGPVTTVTASMGLATYPRHARDLDGLRQAADAALYRAKEAGRNRVCSA